MKKVLWASTALLGFAGMAAADVTISGSGRFGLVYTDTGLPGGSAPKSTPEPVGVG